jgi:hypothetical protein
MVMRRPHRSIETFDISLMAVVTKAMGAFLVMMLLLIPSYIALPEMQTKLSDVEAETRQLEQKAASLTKENRELEQENAEATAQEGQTTSEQAQAVVILQQSKTPQQSANDKRGGYPALLIFFGWEPCAPADIDFYVERADTPGWPEVRSGRQPLPPGVFEYPQDKLKALVMALADPGIRYADDIARGTAKQRLWIVNAVLPGATYALYAKAAGLGDGCRVAAKVLLTASHSVQSYSAVYRQAPGQSRQIVLLARLHWDGDSLTYEGVDGLHLLTATLARGRDQQRLDERLEKQGFRN